MSDFFSLSSNNPEGLETVTPTPCLLKQCLNKVVIEFLPFCLLSLGRKIVSPLAMLSRKSMKVDISV